MKRKAMCFKRLPFILGSLAPDLCFSFIFRRHEYNCSAVFLRKTILRLYEGRFHPLSARFAYFMGIVSHYLCDYFCYSHSPAFRGNLWDHIKYEWVQRMPAPGELSFFGQEKLGWRRLMDTMDAYIRDHDRDLARDAAAARADIIMGTATAEWLAEAVFRSAEQRSPLSAAAALKAAAGVQPPPFLFPYLPLWKTILP